MDQFWKQFAGSGTDLEYNVFLTARLKLTALYVLLVAIIVFGFSIFLYQSIAHNLTDASDEDFSGVQSHHHFVDNALGSVRNDLMLADLIIIISAAGLSFVLAGKTLQPIQISVEAQKAFAANASHELRTPLTVMRNDIEVFLRNSSPTKESTQKTMVSNLEEIGRMSSIVQDLLLLARSDNNSTSEKTKFDISIVTKNIVERVRLIAEQKHIQLAYVASDVVFINGSQSSLERVILNIIQNSIDHTGRGESIQVKVLKENAQAIIRIIDTGSGIADHDLPHVFKRFYKGNSAKGTGLGLSIVKEIVEQHEGHIVIESIVGKGTIVTVNFPLVV